MQGDAVAQVLDALELLRRGAPHHAVDLVALVEQQFRQERAVLARDARDQGALAHTATSVARSQSAVSATPSRSPTFASHPSTSRAFCDRRPAPVRVDLLGARLGGELERLGVVPARLPADPRQLGDRGLLVPGDVERLAGRGRVRHRADDAVGGVGEVREGPRLLAGAVDRQRRVAGQRLAQQVRDHACGRAGAVGVEGPADRVGQAVLGVGGAAVGLARELGEAVGRARGRAVEDVVLGGRELVCALVDGAGAHVDEARQVLIQGGAEDGVGQALLTSVSVCGLPRPSTIAARWIACEQPASALRASPSTRRSPRWTSQPSRIQAGAARWSETRTS